MDADRGMGGADADRGMGGADTDRGMGGTDTDRGMGGVDADRGTGGLAGTDTDRGTGGMAGPGGTDAGTGRQPATSADGDVSLLDPADGDRFRQRWSEVQARFVDDPQEAVSTADGLVAELMQSLAAGFDQHKSHLETQWQRGGQPDTEELRQALQRYRSFFNRLLAT
jgi:hypothetical protein